MGAGRLDRVRRGFHATFIMSLAVTVTLSALVYIFASPIMGFFGLEEGLRIGVENIRFMTLCFWLFSVYLVVNGVLQGSGDTILPSVSTLSSLIVRITAAYLFVHFGLLGYSAAWVTTPIGWLLAAAISYTRYFSGGWKKKAVAGNLASGGPR
jgi:Na+-driven multidrug efflux pump